MGLSLAVPDVSVATAGSTAVALATARGLTGYGVVRV